MCVDDSSTLPSHLTDIPLPFTKLIEQNSSLKAELAIAERVLFARNERIQTLEALHKDIKEKLDAQERHFEERTEAIRARLDKARGKSSGGVPSLRIKSRR